MRIEIVGKLGFILIGAFLALVIFTILSLKVFNYRLN